MLVACCRQEPNTIVIHIRMLDGTAQAQQEAVGVLGINLIHAAFYMGADSGAIIGSLLNELSRSRIEVSQLHVPSIAQHATCSHWGLVKPVKGIAAVWT